MATNGLLIVFRIRFNKREFQLRQSVAFFFLKKYVSIFNTKKMCNICVANSMGKYRHTGASGVLESTYSGRYSEFFF